MSNILEMHLHSKKNLPMPANKPVQKTENQNKLGSGENHTNSKELKDEFIKEHKKNGLFERFYNFLKNKTNIGLGSKKIEQSIKDYENGKLTENEVKAEITKYRSSQRNAKDILGDGVSIGAATGAYYFITNNLKKIKAILSLPVTEAAEGTKDSTASVLAVIQDIRKNPKAKFINKLLDSLKSNKKIIGLGAIAAVLAGGLAKSIALKVNSIGSTWYGNKKKKDFTKEELKAIKKAKNKENRNFLTGMRNGLFAPVIGITGAIVGVGAYIASSFGLRYLSQNKENRSFEDFKEKLKDNAALNAIGAAIISIPLIRKANYSKVLDINLQKVVDKLKNANLSTTEFSGKSSYEQLEEILTNSPAIKNIINSYFSSSTEAEKITAIIEENIFAAKFMQISSNYEISNALRENCPSTRTVKEAAEFISQTFGKKYEVSKQLGVGTIAETYLAKDTQTGKEVCIKILKKGISPEKIDADKDKFIELVKSQVTDPKEQEYLLKNIEDLAAGIRNEVDFTNEMNAAKELMKYTQKANVATPIEVKNNIYVMEKANGISVKTLQDIISSKDLIEFYEMFGDTKKIEEINKHIEEIKARTPDFDITGIEPKQIRKMLSQYIDVIVEQFNKLHKDGKVLHADIHPGNIFIDLDALRSGKGKLLTLIDTGNTVSLSKLQSQNSMKLQEFISNGNVKDLSRYVLEGATLPDNMTTEKALEIMEQELNELFFNDKSKAGLLTSEKVLTLTSNIMRKYNIFPADTQLNMLKAQTSAHGSFESLARAFFTQKYRNCEHNATATAKAVKDATIVLAEKPIKVKIQEFKNGLLLGIKSIFRRNTNNPKTNSEEYLTFKFKQYM